MTHIRQRLPLRVAEQTPSRIDTADGQSVSVSWMNTTHKNPYGDAEEFAAYIVRAVNAHDGLVAALSEVSDYLDNYIDAEIDAETGRTIPNEAMRLQSMVDEALQKAKRA